MPVAPTGQRTLPSNPNCVSFAATAGDVLRARPWRDVQRIAARALQRFHAESGLDVVAAFAWRAVRDRQNRKVHQVTLAFVVDGPATADHLAALEQEVARGAVAWSRSNVERIPPNAIPSLLMSGGALFQLWVVRGGRPVTQRLVIADGERPGVTLVDVSGDQVDAADFLDGVTHVVGRPPALDELDADIERMRLVFAEHFTRRIIEADGVLHSDEVSFVDRVFPAELLDRFGLDASSKARWLAEARDRLPSLLGHHDKLAMIGLFFSACYSDGSLDAREVRLLREAGEVLGLTRHEVVQYLQRLW